MNACTAVRPVLFYCMCCRTGTPGCHGLPQPDARRLRPPHQPHSTDGAQSGLWSEVTMKRASWHTGTSASYFRVRATATQVPIRQQPQQLCAYVQLPVAHQTYAGVLCSQTISALHHSALSSSSNSAGSTNKLHVAQASLMPSQQSAAAAMLILMLTHCLLLKLTLPRLNHQMYGLGFSFSSAGIPAAPVLMYQHAQQRLCHERSAQQQYAQEPPGLKHSNCSRAGSSYKPRSQ
jgi:hypothetical protein